MLEYPVRASKRTGRAANSLTGAGGFFLGAVLPLRFPTGPAAFHQTAFRLVVLQILSRRASADLPMVVRSPRFRTGCPLALGCVLAGTGLKLVRCHYW